MAKILLIDDDPLMLAFMARILQPTGHIVSGLSVGMNALANYEAIRPDLSVMDVWMPGQDGFETLRAIRKSNPEAKVIMCSGHPSYFGRRMAEVAAENEATAFLSKPFDYHVLVDIITRALRGEPIENAYGRRSVEPMDS